MLANRRLYPAAPLQLFHQSQIRFVKTSDTVRPRSDYFANAYHFTGHISEDSRSSSSGVSSGKDGHAHRRLCILRQANGPSEDIGTKLAPIAAAGCATGKGQFAANRDTQHIESIETEPLDECYSLKQPGIEINFIDRCTHHKTPCLNRNEGKDLAARGEGICDDAGRFTNRSLCVQLLEIASGKSLCKNSCSRSRRTPGQPVAIGRAVRVDGGRRVAD